MSANRRDFLTATATVMTAAGAAGAAGAATAAADAAGGEGGPGVPSVVQPIRVFNLRELEERAKAVLPLGNWSFIAGASGDEWTKAENEAAFHRVTLAPHFLGGVREVDTSTTLLGSKLAAPIIVCPMGNQGLAHTTAEAGMAIGTAAEGLLMACSTQSTLPMEAIMAASTGPKWFQLYMPEDRGIAAELVTRAKAAGFKAILFTVDTQGGSPSERSLKAGFKPSNKPHGNFTKAVTTNRGLSWDDVAFVQKTSGLPVLVKGVLTERTVKQAVAAGVAGIQVSNHGGRGVDGSPATITVLPRLVQAADGKLTIVLDSGVRRGKDILRALALGAHAVGVGRPVYWGLGLGGSEGVKSVLAKLRFELQDVMMAMGAAKLSDIDSSFVNHA
ncbi:MAG TPA: alpha-hydroxy acid oxidase [Caulobacteraceae bacterium]|nr:alpha-hydroxy acid oxidase [Caulobacteraceae bacterium]